MFERGRQPVCHVVLWRFRRLMAMKLYASLARDIICLTWRVGWRSEKLTRNIGEVSCVCTFSGDLLRVRLGSNCHSYLWHTTLSKYRLNYQICRYTHGCDQVPTSRLRSAIRKVLALPVMLGRYLHVPTSLTHYTGCRCPGAKKDTRPSSKNILIRPQL